MVQDYRAIGTETEGTDYSVPEGPLCTCRAIEWDVTVQEASAEKRKRGEVKDGACSLSIKVRVGHWFKAWGQGLIFDSLITRGSLGFTGLA